MAFDAKAKMEKTLEGIKNEMNTIRTGRASAAMFDKVRVDYYGQKSPLNQVAQISIPEARTVVISPFDKSLISDIEKAILVADLGLNPSNDGLVKQAKSMAENYKTTIRNVRRDGNDDLKKQQKAGEITEDQLKKETDDLQKLTDKYIAEIQTVCDAKEKEILA